MNKAQFTHLLTTRFEFSPDLIDRLWACMPINVVADKLTPEIIEECAWGYVYNKGTLDATHFS